MTRMPLVLLADDDEDYLFVAERALQKAGLQARIESARDGMEVLRRLGLDSDPEGGQPPEGLAAIFLDMNMPVLNGLEVLRRIRQGRWTREIPVVMVSTSSSPDEVRESYGHGANSFLVKRADGNPGAYLAGAVRYWVELNEPPKRR